MTSFNFSFSGDDIGDDVEPNSNFRPAVSQAAETGSLRHVSTPAFPIEGYSMLKPKSHDLRSLLQALPSKISYSTLKVKLDDGTEISIPRRELWDVRIQLMAEEDDEGLGNLGKDDVRTGIYEGGFKSWESSIDLVKVLHGRGVSELPGSFLELGCGTALPSLAVFQWFLQSSLSCGLDLGLADYNSTVLQLVTLPNLLLSWAQVTRSGWEAEGELEIDQDIVQSFVDSLEKYQITLSFFSGAWSSEFVELVIGAMNSKAAHSIIVGAETIYSPAALRSFADTLIGLLAGDSTTETIALVAAKKVYFGVGGSMEDFCEAIRAQGKFFKQIREEADGVRRAIVEINNHG